MSTVNRRALLSAAGLGGAAAVIGRSRPAAAVDRLAIVEQGRPSAVLVLARSRAAQVTAAAELLVDTVRRATGVALSQRSEDAIPPEEAELNRVYLGVRGAWSPAGVDGLLAGLDTDGFVIAPGVRSLTILGSQWGTEFGAIELCRRHVGAVWLMPTDTGVHVPRLDSLSFPLETVRQEPVFRSRAMSPLFNAGHTDTLTDADPLKQWAARQRAHWRIEFHHNLANLFPVAKYGNPALATYRPDFYPIHDGATHIPPAGKTIQWQPRFSAPGIAEEAAATIIAYLAPRPHLESYSLGVNDSGGFSEDEVDLGVLNSVGYADASVPYYRFVNQVAEIVAAARPDIKLGLLAYTNVADPPPFALHPNVVPFLTRDRYGWVDAAIEAEDRRATLAWKGISREVGWYDYRYGTPYAVPRVDTATVGRALAWAASVGVTRQYAELYPNWGEGPKPWVYSELTWNPHQDVRALESRWYQLAVGTAAAAPVRDYFLLWERFWTDRVAASAWFRTPRMYYYFVDQSYLQLATEADIDRSRSLLERAATAATESDHAARLEVIRRQFEFYEASTLSYPRTVPAVATPAAGLALLRTVETTLDRNVALADRRAELLAAFKSDPLMRHGIDLNGWYKIGWTGWNLNAAWELARFLRRNPGSVPVRLRLATLARGDDRVGRFARMTLAMAGGGCESLGQNMDFGSGELGPWTIDNEWKTADQARVEPVGAGHRLRLPAGFQGTVMQTVPVAGGAVRLTARIRTLAEPGQGGYYLVAQLQALDAAGGLIRQFWSPWVAVADADGGETAQVTDLLPEGTAAVRIAINMQLKSPLVIEQVTLEHVAG